MSILRAVIYARVSSEYVQANREKVSIPSQLAESRERITKAGWLFVGEHIDAERYRDAKGKMVEPAAYRVDRPAFVRMLADGRAGQFDVVVAWKEDRLCRGIKAGSVLYEFLTETRVQVELVKETFDLRMLGIKSALSGIEVENIRERVIMGQVGRMEKGLPHGGRTPRGYIAVRGDNGRAQAYEFDPQWREFFDEVARLFVRGATFSEIGYQMGVNPDTGSIWHSSTIYALLANPFYRGIVTNGKMQAKGKHPPAWGAQTLKAIEQEFKRRSNLSRNGPRRRKRPCLFSGIVRCGYCGRALAGVSGAKIKDAGRARGYLCTLPDYGRHRRDPSLIHPRVYINEKKLLSMLQRTIAELDEATIDAFARNSQLPDADSQERGEALRVRLGEAVERLCHLEAALDAVRDNPVAAQVIVLEVERARQRRASLQAEVDGLAGSGGVDVAQLCEDLLYLQRTPEVFDLPREELAPLLRSSIPALYIKDGRFCAPPHIT